MSLHTPVLSLSLRLSPPDADAADRQVSLAEDALSLTADDDLPVSDPIPCSFSLSLADPLVFAADQSQSGNLSQQDVSHSLAYLPVSRGLALVAAAAEAVAGCEMSVARASVQGMSSRVISRQEKTVAGDPDDGSQSLQVTPLPPDARVCLSVSQSAGSSLLLWPSRDPPVIRCRC